jgi:hypothetical protein
MAELAGSYPTGLAGMLARFIIGIQELNQRTMLAAISIFMMFTQGLVTPLAGT